MDLDQRTGFPRFRDGDVTIIVSSCQTYQLHSSILRRNSEFFAHEFETALPARLTPAARREGCAAFHFELFQRSPGDIGVFIRKDVSPQGRVIGTEFALSSFDNARVNEEQFKCWDWLFGAFYNQQPSFDDHNLATVLSGCMGLVDVAERISAVEQVREFIDLALLRQDQTLWASVAGNPTAWAELGRRVHSHMIFKEGICHLVGRWQTMTEAEKTKLHPEINTLCQRKYRELELTKEAIELRILGHYPSFLCRNASAKPTRPTYSNDIYMWMAVCFFRQWFAQAISDDRTRRSPDGGFNFYTNLSKAGQHYLNHEDFGEFHRYFPMSSKACNVLESNMAVMKEEVRKFVTDLVTNRCHITDLSDHSIDWLTCTQIGKKDCPWYVPGEEDEVGEDVVLEKKEDGNGNEDANDEQQGEEAGEKDDDDDDDAGDADDEEELFFRET